MKIFLPVVIGWVVSFPAFAQNPCIPAYQVVEPDGTRHLPPDKQNERDRLLAAGAESVRVFISFYDDCKGLLSDGGKVFSTYLDSYEYHLIPIGLPIQPADGDQPEDFEFQAVKMAVKEKAASGKQLWDAHMVAFAAEKK